MTKSGCYGMTKNIKYFRFRLIFMVMKRERTKKQIRVAQLYIRPTHKQKVIYVCGFDKGQKK
jgi:hypothetical protein